jgi:type VI protein secretion system component VasF
MQTLPANTTVKALPSVAGTAGKPAAPYLQRWASINYERRTMKKKTKYWIAAAACVLLAMYFFMWTIQTAWLGSFPGRDIEL